MHTIFMRKGTQCRYADTGYPFQLTQDLTTLARYNRQYNTFEFTWRGDNYIVGAEDVIIVAYP